MEKVLFRPICNFKITSQIDKILRSKSVKRRHYSKHIYTPMKSIYLCIVQYCLVAYVCICLHMFTYVYIYNIFIFYTSCFHILDVRTFAVYFYSYLENWIIDTNHIYRSYVARSIYILKSRTIEQPCWSGIFKLVSDRVTVA